VHPHDWQTFVLTSGSGGSPRSKRSKAFARPAVGFAAISTLALRGWLISPDRILRMIVGDASARVSTAFAKS
jgi:hypothetical protein